MAELGKSSILRRQNLVKKPPFSNRLSERAKGDPKICEILVNKVEKKDLGDWRSNLFHSPVAIWKHIQVCRRMHVLSELRGNFDCDGNP